MKKDPARINRVVILRDQGLTYQMIADELGVTRQRTEAIYKRAKRIQRRKLKSD